MTPRDSLAHPPRGTPWLQPHRADPRFAYGLYLPARAQPGRPLGVVVSVHDSRRLAMECVQGFTAFAEAHHHAVLAPLFPRAPALGGEHGYKAVREGALHFDTVLHAMLGELADAVPCEVRRVMLHGYSGGGQFAHRYLLAHPRRVRAASVGAPGEVTVIDHEVDWWAGVRDMPAIFGHPLDAAALRQVPLQLLVGDQDTDTHEVREQPPSRWWPSDASRRQSNRIQRLQTLRRSLEAHGVSPRFTFMPGIEHGQGPGPSMARAAEFFAARLQAAPARA